MALRMPIIDASAFRYRIRLGDTHYRLRYVWSGRTASWYISIATEDGAPIVAGRRLVIGVPLFARHQDPRLPDGDFLALDLSGQDLEAGRDDLGSRVVLWFVGRDEIDAVRAASAESDIEPYRVTVP